MSKEALTILIRAGISDTHWGRRIWEAEERGHFTDEDIEDSASWVTCACGKLSPLVPVEPSGMPLDGKLSFLGTQFNEDVSEGGFEDAAWRLVDIEKRATRLLAST